MLKNIYLLIFINLLLTGTAFTAISCEGKTGLWSDICGRYINIKDVNQYIDIDQDGTFFLKGKSVSVTGKWTIKGNVITISDNVGLAERGKIENNTIIWDWGDTFVKYSSALSTSFPTSKINGTYNICREAAGKIELNHKVVDEGIPPKIEISLKNVSDTQIDIGSDNRYYQLFLQVISKDKAGQILGKPQLVYFSLQPKEVKKENVTLFSSDETQSYEIQLQVKNPPDIKGVYIQSPESAGKVEVSHYVKVGASIIVLTGVIKNISKDTLGRSWYDGSYLVKENWYINAKFKDASGIVVVSKEEIVAADYAKLVPGQTRSFVPIPYNLGNETVHGFDIPENTRNYEITVFKKIERNR